MKDAITHVVSTGGVVAIFLLMLAESCGIPIPSEVTMPFAGFAASTGSPGLVEGIAAGSLGNLAGSMLAWGLAARFGEPLLLGPGRRVGIRRDHLELADRWFQRHGLSAVFLGRLLPVIRTYISFPAGLARVEPVRFAVLTLLGCIPWCAALAIAGYKVGQNWDSISRPIEMIALVLAAAVAALMVAWFVRGRTAARGHGES